MSINFLKLVKNINNLKMSLNKEHEKMRICIINLVIFRVMDFIIFFKMYIEKIFCNNKHCPGLGHLLI